MRIKFAFNGAIILLLLLPVLLHAAWQVKPKVSCYCLVPEEELQLTICIAGEGSQIDAFGFDVTFPNNLLQFSGAEFGQSIVQNWDFKSTNQLDSSRIRIAGFSITDPFSAANDTGLVTLNFQVKPAVSGTDWIRLGAFRDDLVGVAPESARVEIKHFQGWLTPVRLIHDQREFGCTFGGHPDARAGFDPDLDSLAAPPAMNFYPYFAVPDFPFYLNRDIRNWSFPLQSNPAWQLKLSNTRHKPTQLSWDATTLPDSGYFYLESPTQIVDMRHATEIIEPGEGTIAIFYRPQPEPIEWTVPLTITGAGFSITRAFGGHFQATDDYDSTDSLAAPPGMTPYACFQIDDFPNYLVTDTREWRRPYGTSRKWRLIVSNVTGAATVQWFKEALPDIGYFYLLTADSCVNLRERTHFNFSGSQQLDFEYHPFPLMSGWDLPFKIQFSEKAFEVQLGGNAAATDGFDPGIDLIAPPPGMTGYAWLGTNEFPYYLSADYRNWQPAGRTALTWTLNVQIPEGDSATVEWDVRRLPQIGAFQLSAPGITQNLRLPDTLTLVASQALQIDYVPSGTLSKPKTNLNRIEAQQAFELAQNFPNPFNNETILRYQLPVADHVEISIFNCLGQKITTLVAGRQSAGVFEIKWNGLDATGRRVPSGLYFYRLQTSRMMAVRKMLLMQ